MLIFNTIFPLITMAIIFADASPSSSFICGGCVLLINELEKQIEQVDPHRMISAGSFRVNQNGDQQGLQQVPYARSQSHISDILESACDHSKNYKLVVNPLTGKAVFVHKDATYLKGDESLKMRSKLHGACNDLVDSNEDDIIQFLGKSRDEQVKEYCQLHLGVCSAVDMTALPPDEPVSNETEDSNDEL